MLFVFASQCDGWMTGTSYITLPILLLLLLCFILTLNVYETKPSKCAFVYHSCFLLFTWKLCIMEDLKIQNKGNHLLLVWCILIWCNILCYRFCRNFLFKKRFLSAFVLTSKSTIVVQFGFFFLLNLAQ